MREHGWMPTNPPTRSVRISDDERGGWSSDRPRRDGAPPRPANVAVRCRVLKPADRLRYSPGSLVVVVSGSAAQRDRFVERLIDDRGSILSLDKVRGLLKGRVAEEEIEERAQELLAAAMVKRMAASETVVVPAEGVDPQERDAYVRLAVANKRPRHLIFIDAAKDQVAEEDHATVNDLRRALDAGELGAEGFQTALRLGGGTVDEVKALLFRPPPRDDD
jgi:predicted kinase